MQLKSAQGRWLWFILVLMTLPAINHKFEIVLSKPLMGVNYNGKPPFIWKNVWNGSWQPDMELYLNDFTGFRSGMVRTVNQINFTFFNKLTSQAVFIGKNHNLFYEDYVDEWCGIGYKGDNFPLEAMCKLKKIQDTFEKAGKLFVMVHAGSKASYFASDIPDYINCNCSGKTNLKNYVRLADSLGINQIDFNSWFASLNGKKPHHLFNIQGIHWNMYGAYFAIDSLITYIERKRNIHMPHPHVVKMQYSHEAQNAEDDLEVISNLIFPITNATYWYPQIEYDTAPGLDKPKVIYIGDSFTWTFLHDGIFNANKDPEYWYYFQTVVFEDYKNGSLYKALGNYDWPGTFKKADCIVMMYTITQMVQSSREFIDKTYDYYYPGISVMKQ
jgi:hypothetical protein